MDGVFVAMAILGCGDAGSACQTLRILDPNFETVGECMDAAPGILRNLTELDFPEVHIDCDARPVLAARMDAERVG
ncbi:MAG: hypothetical protein V2J26_00675 [Pacificimonas sp.]|jgi:hypothetical protein|nr:hypothetical protein [Pacificimonas sp.]